MRGGTGELLVDCDDKDETGEAFRDKDRICLGFLDIVGRIIVGIVLGALFVFVHGLILNAASYSKLFLLDAKLLVLLLNELDILPAPLFGTKGAKARLVLAFGEIGGLQSIKH